MSKNNSNSYQNRVRIIGGEYRRRVLEFPDQPGLRPTPDRVRETVFNWLGQDLTGQSVLDLFAGSGAMGFEAASRHAARVVMIEKARPVARQLQANARLLGCGRIHVVEADALHWLAQVRESFDVIVMDPPFATDLLAQALPRVAACLAPRGVVYVEAETLPDLAGWDVWRQGRAGKVSFALLRPAEAPCAA
ncbi:16S rRNA (guanine(966)-N(2))-methyltransferase RsmD [Laribacter hongkongensis]|uniref:16S rRNA (guanine(966)-N(2))-methyltransferase RsmD n=1 Tax=Laribacter hongkongensis TaxID=168471 RepID=UPI001EFD170A|nr:16S rRNA (guanine(966)-N(2))-methyltransferase RsmD [Laribacter hongkongensis]MCG9099133.1 16S rRNA (guanine(966)-N(2))-methyltransferase RsmD [Laribacter hongkongensis]